jgi:hypothetical protein
MEVEDFSYDNRWDLWTKVSIITHTPLFIIDWDWCKANCKGRYDAMSGIGKGRHTWIFENPEDALMFKMTRL